MMKFLFAHTDTDYILLVLGGCSFIGFLKTEFTMYAQCKEMDPFLTNYNLYLLLKDVNFIFLHVFQVQMTAKAMFPAQ